MSHMSHKFSTNKSDQSLQCVDRGVDNHPSVKKPPYDIPAVCDTGVFDGESRGAGGTETKDKLPKVHKPIYWNQT